MAYLENYRDFLKEEKGRALLSYIPDKMKENAPGHEYKLSGNQMKALYIPRALNELGYIVDYMDWKDTNWKRTKDYDLFIGHGGYNFEYVAKQLENTKIIYFATGFYHKLFNQLEADRFDDLEKRRGARLPPDRMIRVDEEPALMLSDGIICLGNQACADSYSKFKNVVPVGSLPVQSDWDRFEEKDYAKGAKHFLFYSGDGNVHKGLDLILEALAGTDLHLHICQRMNQDFEKVYENELALPNIHNHEKILLNSLAYKNLVMLCNWIISATCCEGCPNAVLESMAHGLIPVVPYNASVDVDNFGFILPLDKIRETVLKLSRIEPDEARFCSEMAQDKIRTYYSPMPFLERFKEAVRQIV